MFSLDEEEKKMPIEFFFFLSSGGELFFGFSRYRTHSKFSVVFHAVWDIGRGLDDTHAYTLAGLPGPTLVDRHLFSFHSFSMGFVSYSGGIRE